MRAVKINHGDYEPLRGCRLIDHEGYVWKRVDQGWQYTIEGAEVVPYEWQSIPPAFFPMELLP